MKPTPQTIREHLCQRYDQMWAEAFDLISTGKVKPDPVLAEGLPDERRGLTLIARPSSIICKSVTAFLKELHAIEPEQYYYSALDLHLTVLSLFTATSNPSPFLAQTDCYVQAVDSVLAEIPGVLVEFEGVTASSGAILIQGFVQDGRLNDLRESLRRRLRTDGLAQGLDRRYRLETAHMTVARFRAPLRDGKRFAKVLALARRRRFGTCRLETFSLVKNDWYMTHQTVEVLRTYGQSTDD